MLIKAQYQSPGGLLSPSELELTLSYRYLYICVLCVCVLCELIFNVVVSL